jgi:hypothetical protein
MIPSKNSLTEDIRAEFVNMFKAFALMLVFSFLFAGLVGALGLLARAVKTAWGM